LQRLFKKYTNRGQRYKYVYIKKEISKVNKGKREIYSRKNKNKPFCSFWDRKIFTDEAYIDPSSQRQDYTLCEQLPFGDRYNPENIQERKERKGVKLYVAAWVSYRAKAEKLEFYNNKEDYIEIPKRPRKPRRRKHESTESFEQQIRE
jgi:hypothetical protein